LNTIKEQINPLYAYEAVQDQMRTAFKNSKPCVILVTDFFLKDYYQSLFRSLKSLSGKEIYEPHKYRFEEIYDTNLSEMFSSNEFFEFVGNITGVKVNKANLSNRRVGAGDYTLLHDDVIARKRLIFFYTLCDKLGSDWGGSTVFTFGDERVPLVFEPKGNSLVIMSVPEGMRDFVKYVKHFAGKNEIIKVEGTLS
jgi:Rps23 Pro-64 3,4-dihydroxylase Tpa1-like proline 4-hydroxylase